MIFCCHPERSRVTCFYVVIPSAGGLAAVAEGPAFRRCREDISFLRCHPDRSRRFGGGSEGPAFPPRPCISPALGWGSLLLLRLLRRLLLAHRRRLEEPR